LALRSGAGALFAGRCSPFATGGAPFAGPTAHHPELLVGEYTTECILTRPLGSRAPVGDLPHRIAMPVLDPTQLGALLSGERRHLGSLALHHLLTHLRAIAGCGWGGGRGLGGERGTEHQGRNGKGKRFHGIVLHLVREPACMS
jgi:hypothetical protein